MSDLVGTLVQHGRAALQADQDDLVAPAIAVPVPVKSGHDAGASFASTIVDALHRVDAQERTAADKMAAVDSGKSDDLVGAMLSSQQASLSFSMLMQVRNKVVAAVEDLVKLPL